MGPQGIVSALDLADAEYIAAVCIYKLREAVRDKPNLRLLAAKALLGKVKTMVEDLEQGGK